MARIGSFSTVRFTRKDGYVISNIDDDVARPGFQRYLDELARQPNKLIDLGMPRDVRAGALEDLLSQLREQPINNGVKQIDIRGIGGFVRYTEKHDGFREFWIIDDNASGRINGTRLDDVILGRGGNDRIAAGAGDDFVDGGPGRDKILGGRGDDFLKGGAGADTIIGGDGNDKIFGGNGSDLLIGSGGADAFFFEASDFAGGRTRDIIRDFGRGDQIVDLTGDLRVIATGQIKLFGGKGTLIENIKTHDQIFVANAFLTQDDIGDNYKKPKPGADGGPYRVVQKVDVYDFTVRKTGEYTENGTKVEIYSVFMSNEGKQTIANIADLDVKLTEAGKLDIQGDRTFNATYKDGVFDLASAGERTIPADSEIELFGFFVRDRPDNVVIDANDFVAVGYTPENPGGKAITDEVGFRITVKITNPFDGGASAEVYIRNIGNTTLTDLENIELRFTDRSITVTDKVWGADYYSRTFAVEPWAGDSRPDLAPGQATKLFGFTFETDHGVVDPSDFRLVSNFDDLLS
ncbi:calcium-binding protein [Acuticoccus sp. M5D2P5]|uniref:calcium-binding protein n=1 Tax=Acuticoccus kalidii TaxID=2910977 RepID=UPI001F2C77E8|nr:calcium-binding protein [Acuticoccus kalidii]MCF3935769.1 calcium-binding protein [Acuticoccus kalidii]